MENQSHSSPFFGDDSSSCSSVEDPPWKKGSKNKKRKKPNGNRTIATISAKNTNNTATTKSNSTNQNAPTKEKGLGGCRVGRPTKRKREERKSSAAKSGCHDLDEDSGDSDTLLVNYKSKPKPATDNNDSDDESDENSGDDDRLLVSYKSKPKSPSRSTSSPKKKLEKPKMTKKKKKKQNEKKVKKEHVISATSPSKPAKRTTSYSVSSAKKQKVKNKKMRSQVFDLQKIFSPNAGHALDEDEEANNSANDEKGYKIGYECVPYVEMKGGHEKILPTLPFYERKIPSALVAASNKLSNDYKNKKQLQLKEDIELLLESGIAPILRRLGWKINGRYSTFKFKMDSKTTYSIRRKEILSSIKRIQPTIERYGDTFISGEDTNNDSLLETLIIEDVLMNRTSRLLEFRKSVEESIAYYPSNKEENDFYRPLNVDVTKPPKAIDTNLEEAGENRSKDKTIGATSSVGRSDDHRMHKAVLNGKSDGKAHAQAAAPAKTVQQDNQTTSISKSTNSNNQQQFGDLCASTNAEDSNNLDPSSLKNARNIHSRSSQNGKSLSRTSSKKSSKLQNGQVKNKTKLKIISSSKANDEKNYIKIIQVLPQCGVLTDDALREARRLAYDKVLKTKVTEENQRSLLNLKLQNIKNDPWSAAVVFKGEEDLVKMARRLLLDAVLKSCRQSIAEQIMNKQDTYEFCICIDTTMPIGMTCSKCQNQSTIPFVCKKGEQVERILGNTTNKGAVLCELKCHSQKQWKAANYRKEVYEEARDRFQKSGQEEDKIVIAKICLNGTADLNKIDFNAVLNGVSGIRRRNGSKVKLNMLKRKRSNPNVICHSNRYLLKMKNRQNIASGDINTHDATKQTSPRNKSLSNHEQVLPLSKKPRPEAVKFYNYFSDKMKPVKTIEFSPFKISHQLATGRMWDAHKKLIGEECDENCPCPSMLGHLTKSVIRHYLQKEKEKGHFDNIFDVKETDSMVGFANRFCGKFYIKVRNKFLKDSHHQTLERLCAMWGKHRQQMRFGTECREDCECGSSWFELFLPACKKCFSNGGEQEDDLAEAAINGKKAPSATVGRKSRADQVKDVDISISFKPKKNTIGLYFTNDRGKCVISSVQPDGLAVTRNRNIKLGLVVLGISAGNNMRHSINTWQEIETEYTTLKQTNNSMQIWFTKDTVHNSNTSILDSKNDWTTNGAWTGDSCRRPGWAGGARIVKGDRVSEQDNMTKLGRHENHVDFREKISQINKKCDPPSMKEKIKNRTLEHDQSISMTEKHHSTQNEGYGQKDDNFRDVESEINISYPRPVLLSGNQPRSIMRKRKLSDDCRVKFLDDRENDATPHCSRKSRLHEIKEAVLLPRENLNLLVQQFKKTPMTKDEFDSLNLAMQETLKDLEENKSTASDQGEYDVITSNMEALKPKQKALVIYDRAAEVMDMVRYLNNPSLITFKLVETNIKLTSNVNEKSKKSKLYCTLVVNRNEVASTSKVNFDENIHWTEIECNNELSTLHVDSQTDGFYGKDEAKITLFREDSDGGCDTQISCAALDINEINFHSHSKRHSVNDFVTIDFQQNSILEKGSLVLVPEIADAMPEKVQQKRDDMAQKLKDIVYWVERFQADYSKTQNLICDMTSFENISLLHAAIACCRKDLVQNLLRLGARTDVPSNIFGTPIVYARKLVKDMQITKEKDRKRLYHDIIQILDRKL